MIIYDNKEYFDAKEVNENEHEMDEEFFPAQSMFIENEWIRNSPGGETRTKSTMEPDEFTKSTIRPHEIGKTSPYFETARIESEKVRFISPIQNLKTTPIESIESVESSPRLNKSILNELLPTQVQLDHPSDNPNPNAKSKIITMTEADFEKYLMNDKIYGQLYKGSMIIWALLSAYLILSNDNQKIPGNFGEITGWFTCLIILGLGLTAVWARLLAEQTEVIVYSLMLAVPAGFSFLGIFSFSHLYIFSGVIFCIISAILASFVYFNKDTLKITVNIVHNAAIFIQATPKVYPLVMKIVAVYVVFVLIWLKAFMELFNNPNLSFVFASSLKVSFILILLWTGSVLSTVQKYVLATWVRVWMNQTDDYDAVVNAKVKELNEGSFGSVCLASGLLTIGKSIRLISKSINFTSKALSKFIPSSGIISELMNWTLSIIFILERSVQRFTDFSVYNLALSEDCDDFVQSCRQVGRIIGDQIRLTVTTDATAQLLLKFSTILISFTSTTLILLVAKTHVSWSSSLLIGLLAASITDFVSNTYTSAIDSMFLCYLIDLKKPEKAGKIDTKIQEAFEMKISPV